MIPLEQLLELALKHADQAEIRLDESHSTGISFADAMLDEVNTKFTQSIHLRLIKDGKLGTAVTCNLIDPQEFVEHAIASLRGGVEAPFSFPATRDVKKLHTYDASIEKVENTDMVEEIERLSDKLKTATGSEVSGSNGKSVNRSRLLNSAGTDLSNHESYYYIWFGAGYPGGAASVSRLVMDKTFVPFGDDMMQNLVDRYNAGRELVKPDSGRMEVLFMPQTMITLLWRLTAATSGAAVYRKITPLLERMGQKVLSDKFTMVNNPLDDSLSGAEAYDGEGVATRELPIFENGVLRNFYYDLRYAAKCGVQPTGTGSGGVPGLHHVRIMPGQKSIAEMIKGMKRGLLLEGIMGAHSGNIINGDFSVGATPAYYVEDGHIVGLVKDVMVAGSVYETLSNVVDLSRERSFAHTDMGGGMGYVPAVLCENVSVTCKK